MVDGVYAVLKKRSSAPAPEPPYLALELSDSTGRISGRVWNDVDLLDSRFSEGDAVHVLGRVEKFRDRLQLEVRALEPAEADPASLAPALRRDADELDGFVEFLTCRSTTKRSGARRPRARGCAAAPRVSRDARRSPLVRRWTARAHGRRGDDLPRALATPSTPPRRPPRGRCPASRRRAHAGARPAARVPAERRRTAARPRAPWPSRSRGGAARRPAELLHAVAAHHDVRAARTAEAAVLYHANQLDAAAATRPVE